jgi:hypothetical protein
MKNILTLILILFSLNSFAQKDTTFANKDTLHFSILAGGQITAGNFNNFGFNFSSELRKVHGRNYWTITPNFRVTMQKAF